MAGINHLHHIGMSVPSLALARRFYVELLGFEEVAGGSFDADSKIDRILKLYNAAGQVSFFRLGALFIEMFEFSRPSQTVEDQERPVYLHGITHICLDVDDVCSLHKRLAAGGMNFHSAPVEAAGVKTCYGRDPFGNVIELQQILTEEVVLRV